MRTSRTPLNHASPAPARDSEPMTQVAAAPAGLIGSGRTLVRRGCAGTAASDDVLAVVTAGGARVQVSELVLVRGTLHVVVDAGWTWSADEPDVVGDARFFDPAGLEVRLVGWWSWYAATGTLALDLAAATVRAGSCSVELQDDDATTALLA